MQRSGTKRSKFATSRKVGGSNAPAFDADVLQQHALLVDSQQMKAYLRQNNELTEPNSSGEKIAEAGPDSYDAFEIVRQEKQTENKILMDMIHGRMFSVYRDYMRQCVKQHIVVTNDGGHVCTARCELVELFGRVYAIPGSKNRVHVCIKNVPCDAPPQMHQTLLKEVNGTVYVCSASERVHICTPEACDAKRVHTTNYICCELTGKVLETNPMHLTHGWVEDEWRLHQNGYNEDSLRECKGQVEDDIDVIVAKSNRSLHKVSRPRKRKKKRRKTTGGEFKISVGRRIKSMNTLLEELHDGLKQSNPTQKLQNRMDDILEGMYRAAQWQILELLPGSSTREQFETDHRNRTTQRVMFAVDKYAKRRACLNAQLCTHDIISLFRQISDWTATCDCEAAMYLSREKAAVVANAYARNAVNYMCTLMKRTNFMQSEVCFEDYICAVLYLQRTHFRANTTSIFFPDEFLLVLPYASSLDVYGYTKNAFTSAKTAVLDAVLEAVETLGVDAGQLIYPICSFCDLFVI